jgi:hypothetical protein
MKTFRVAAGIFAVIPLVLVAYITLFLPSARERNSWGELAYMLFGVPMLIVNLWAWMYSEIIKVYFFGKHKQA